jgi:plastocyanin
MPALARPTDARPGWLVWAACLATLVAAGALLLALAHPPGRAAEVIVITELDRFAPDEIEVLTGGTVLVRNRDWYAHTFTLEDLHISVYVPPHGERRIELPAAPGSYRLSCEIPGHGAMLGEVHIRPLGLP